MSERLLRVHDVAGQIGKKRSWIYQACGEGRFPEPLQVGGSSVWPESSVQQWIHEQIATAKRGTRSEPAHLLAKRDSETGHGEAA